MNKKNISKNNTDFKLMDKTQLYYFYNYITVL